VTETIDTADATRTPWAESVIVVLGAFTAMLASTALNPAASSIAQQFGIGLSSAQWLASGYLLALAAGVPVSGWASRRYGATRLWLVGLGAFGVLSIGCALAPSFPVLLCCRLLQGVAGGVLVPAGQTILGRLAGAGRLGRVMSVTGIAVVVAPSLGTSVGGLVTAHAGWTWIFWMCVPLCVLALVAGLRRFPAVELGSARRLDWLGLTLSVGGLSLLVFGATEIAAGDRDGVAAGAVAGCGAAALVAFAWWSHRSSSPLLDVRLLSNPVFAAGGLVMALGGAVNFGAQFVLPLYFVDTRAENVAAAGLLIVPQVVGTAIGFPIAGRLTDRGRAGGLLIAGGLLTAAATVPLVLADDHTGYVWLGGVLFVRGLGVALSTIPAMTVSLAAANQDQLPDATALLNVLQRIGASLGSAVAAVVYAAHATTSSLTAFHVVNGWLIGGAIVLAATSTVVVRAERTRINEK
jgi:EmrB/QacA subfamily drug resistance transporter